MNVLWLIERYCNETIWLASQLHQFPQNSQMPPKNYVQLYYIKFHLNSTINIVSMNGNWFTFISKFYIPEFCITLDLTHFLHSTNQMPIRILPDSTVSQILCHFRWSPQKHNITVFTVLVANFHETHACSTPFHNELLHQISWKSE